MMLAAMHVLAAGLMMPEPVQYRQMKFHCYISETPNTPVPLRDKPNEKAKVIAMMPPLGMLTTVDRVKHRGDWMYVQWSPTPESKDKPRKGWILYPEVHFGECED